MDNGYRQLLKMYQFLIDENNELKKEIYYLKKNNFTASAVNRNESSILERSLNQSDYKPKSIVQSSKGEILISNKAQPPKDKPKQKVKKGSNIKMNKK